MEDRNFLRRTSQSALGSLRSLLAALPSDSHTNNATEGNVQDIAPGGSQSRQGDTSRSSQPRAEGSQSQSASRSQRRENIQSSSQPAMRSQTTPTQGHRRQNPDLDRFFGPLSQDSSPGFPDGVYFASDFMIGAGMVILQPSTGKIVVVHDGRTNGWFLPKGRKDVGESLEQTALREAYEEVCLRSPCAHGC